MLGDARRPVDRKLGQGVLVVDVGRADAGERGRVTARPGGLPTIGEAVDLTASIPAASPGSRVDPAASVVEAIAWVRRSIRPAPGRAAGLDGEGDRPGHRGRVAGAGDRAGAEHAVAAELDRQGRVRGRADPGVEDHGHAGSVDDQADVVRVADPHAAADRRAERHHGGAADVLEAAGEDRVVVGVGEDDEAVVDELLGGGEQLDRVGQEGPLVADHLELDPVGRERLAGESGRQDGIPGGVAAGRVREDVDAGRFEHVDQRSARGRGRSAAGRR